MPAPKADKAGRGVTLATVLAEARRRLAAGDMDDPALEARMIVEHFTGTDRRDAIVAPERPVPPNQIEAIDAALARRLAGEPVHRIFGWRDFYGLRLKLSPDTLEPRPDTETLVDAVLPLLRQIRNERASGPPPLTPPHKGEGDDVAAVSAKTIEEDWRGTAPPQNPPPPCGEGLGVGVTPDMVAAALRGRAENSRKVHLLDLGTGTGAIALAIASQIPEALVTATDISSDALATATENAVALGLEDRFIPLISDWFSAVNGKFHGIVSNPPYITTDEIERLQPEVRLHDPRRALDGGKDGLAAYRTIAENAHAYLERGGFVAVEIGEGQRQAVERIFAEAGYGLHATHRDLVGTERVLVFRR